MASDADNSEDLTDGSHGPRECMPCRGTGQVISNLGGAPSHVTCPWCDGSGVRVPGIDAQARWPTEGEAGAPPSGEGEAGASSLGEGEVTPESSAAGEGGSPPSG